MPAFTSAVHPSRARRQAAYTIACLILVALAAVAFVGPGTGNARAATPPQPPPSVNTHPVLKAPSIGSVGFHQAQLSRSAAALTLSGLSDPGVAAQAFDDFSAWLRSGRHEDATLSLVEPGGASARTYYLTACIPTKIESTGADPSQMSVTIACEGISPYPPPPTAPGHVFPAPTTLAIHATTLVNSGEFFPVFAVVTAQGRPVVPTGTVQLSVDGNPQGSPVPVYQAGTSTNQASTTLMATVQAPGVHAITATYTSTDGQTLRSTSNTIFVVALFSTSVPPGSS